MKKKLRAKLKTLRNEIIPSDEAERVRNAFLQHAKLKEGDVIATYSPTGSELNTDKLNRALGYSGYKLCLPCIRDQDLVFREWGIHTEMKANKFGIMEPNPDSRILIPTIIIVPILGFNAKKYRIGYGGGYYDKTLAASPALKVGVAYDAQLVHENFQESYDIPLDLIITEKKVYK